MFLQRVRESLTFGTIIAFVIAIGVTVFAVVDAAADFYGDRPWGTGMLLGPSVVVAFSTIQLLWKGTDATLQQWNARVFGVNALATVACTLAFVVTFGLVPVQYGKGGFQYWFSGGWSTIMFPSLLGFGAALLAAIAALILVVLPVMAIRKPRQLASVNMLDTDPKYARRNSMAGLALVVLLILVFLIPTLVVAFEGAPRIVGFALIPVGIALTIFIGVTQKSDYKRRAAAGVAGVSDMIAQARDPE